MKKILTLLATLLLIPAFAAAQNRTCSECGIVKYNVTYPWQHHTWCPYYRPQSSGSSSSSSSTVSYGAYTAANAATSAIGALLADALFANKQPQKTPEELARDAAADEMERIYGSAYYKKVEEERKYWEWGDYKLDKYTYWKWDSCMIISLVNKRTNKYIIPLYDQKIRSTLTKETKNVYPLGSVAMRQAKFPSKIARYWTLHDFENDRVKFLDSSKEDINPKLDGLLLAQNFWCYENSDKPNKMKWHSYMGVARIVNDTLQWIVKEKAYDGKFIDKIEPLENAPLIYTKRMLLRNSTGGQYSFFRGLYKDLWSWRWTLYDLTGKKKLTTTVYSPANNVFQAYGNIISVREEKKAEDGKITASHKYYDIEMNPHPVLGNYEQVVPRALSGIGYRFIVGSEKDGYGVIDQDGNMIIPQRYDDINMVLGYWNLYAKVSYTRWYRNEAAQYVNKPGEFEKTDHFKARMADKALQEQYLREVMSNAESRYLVDMVESKDNVKLVLGRYLADAECFPIYSSVAPWNACYLSVPMSEAEDFKMTFHKMRDEAMKTVKWCVRNDAPCISHITVTTPEGKTYQTGE